jgi:large subunit ribosomal protein L32e
MKSVTKQKKKKPEFVRQRGKILKRLGRKWRWPRGQASSLRIHYKATGHIPTVGYRNPKSVRGLHPSGFREVLVHNLKDLERINPKTEACRIASTVGKKKKIEIIKRAEELKIKVLNPIKIEKEKKEGEKT